MIDYSFPLEELEYFLLILVRISSFIMVAPFFSSTNSPRLVKVAFSVFIAYVVYGVTSFHAYPEYNSVFQYAVIVIQEVIIGLLLGLSTQFCMLIINFTGNFIDVEIGFSMAQVMDPATRTNLTLTGVMYQYAFSLLLISTGLYRYLITALVETFELIPVGGAHFGLYDMYKSFLMFMTNYIVIGFRISLPVFCTILLLNGIMGIMAKVSPQMNMFAVGMQLKVLVGLCVLFLTVGLLPHAADFIFTQMKVMIVSFVEAMGGN